MRAGDVHIPLGTGGDPASPLPGEQNPTLSLAPPLSLLPPSGLQSHGHKDPRRAISLYCVSLAQQEVGRGRCLKPSCRPSAGTAGGLGGEEAEPLSRRGAAGPDRPGPAEPWRRKGPQSAPSARPHAAQAARQRADKLLLGRERPQVLGGPGQPWGHWSPGNSLRESKTGAAPDLAPT